MKKILFVSIIIILIASGFWVYFRQVQKESASEQLVLEQTLLISRQYVALRYRTDNILSTIPNSSNYEVWNQEMTSIIKDWNILEKDALVLEGSAQTLSISKASLDFKLVHDALAFDKQEVTDIFDKAPAGKKILTLAKQLGIDAKRASLILQQAQNELTADAWNDAGNSLKKLETAATLIKDGAKIGGFVGGIALTGGLSAVSAGTTLAKVTVVVTGADLVLEVSDDASKIALGDDNKISKIISTGRVVTEPLATILTISDIPVKLKTGYEKFNVAMIALEQFNGVVQEGKMIGVALPVYQPAKKFQLIAKHKAPVYVSVIEKDKLDDWLAEEGVKFEEGAKPEDKEPVVPSEKQEPISEKPETVIAPPADALKTTPEQENKAVESNKEIENSNNSALPAESNSAEGVAKDFSLIMKPAEPTNDWQAAIKLFLFSKAPIVVKNNVFSANYSGPFSSLQFIGSGDIRISGKYDKNTGILFGTHYRKYEGSYKDKPQTLIYSGTFSQKILATDLSARIKFSGTTESTSLDGNGKPYTTKSESGVFIEYNIK